MYVGIVYDCWREEACHLGTKGDQITLLMGLTFSIMQQNAPSLPPPAGGDKKLLG